MIVKFLKDTECKYMFGGGFAGHYRSHDTKLLAGTEIGVIRLMFKEDESNSKICSLLCFTDNCCDGDIGFYSGIPLKNILITKDCRSGEEIAESRRWDNFKPGDMK